MLALALSTVVGCVGPEARAPVTEADVAPSAGKGAEAGGSTQARAGDASPAAGAAPVDANRPPQTFVECRRDLPPIPTTFPKRPGNDAQAQLDERFQAYHEAFRCCYDAHPSPQSQRTSGHVALRVTVDYAGKLTSAEIVAQETDVASPDVRACVLETARTVPLAAPANDMDVAYKRVFEFKARR